MDVSIIMVNYNTLELTKNTINSVIEKTSNIDYEIILIDNDSKDGSHEYFSSLNLDNFRYIQSGSNLGFGKANNLGYKIASGNYIFLLNTDTLLVNNAIKILFDEIYKDNKIGVVGGNLYDMDMNPVHSFLKEIYSFKTEIYINFGFILNIPKKIVGILKSQKRDDFNYSNNIIEVGYITGADMMIRRECIEAVGFFDPDFFMYFEETELTSRIKKVGYKIVSVPGAKIIHLEGKSTKFKEQKIKMFNESKFKYFDKVYGSTCSKKVYLINLLSNYLKFILSFNRDYLKIIEIIKSILKK
ncbi:glycosyltransferase family 2 protein [Cetobacterium sp.]|uniref:glycosyltransferase family 2 protein n=1 Tax=Cetobacterium sp. TaxID=2071632 RepID=UPI003F34CAFA